MLYRPGNWPDRLGPPQRKNAADRDSCAESAGEAAQLDSIRAYEPIEAYPSNRTDLAVAQLLIEANGLGRIARLAWGAFAFVGAWPFLVATHAMRGVDHWGALAVSVAILEPLGLLCLVGSIFLVRPNAPMARLMVWAGRKGRAVVLGVFLATMTWIVAGLVFVSLSRVGLY